MTDDAINQRPTHRERAPGAQEDSRRANSESLSPILKKGLDSSSPAARKETEKETERDRERDRETVFLVTSY